VAPAICSPIFVHKNWNGDLLEYLCQTLAPPGRLLTGPMLEQLAASGLIVLVIDGLSERTEKDGNDQLEKLLQRIKCRMIVTSRDNPPSEQFTPVKVGPLLESRLDDFLRLYLSEDKQIEEVRASLQPLLARNK